MSAIVNAIPTLHISLFLFLGGLVEFYQLVNPVIGFLTLGILVLYGGLFLGVAVSAALDRSSPFQTPLSSLFWYGVQLLRQLRQWCPLRVPLVLSSHKRRAFPRTRRIIWSLVQELEVQAMADPSNIHLRELMTFRWTLESLTDNIELEYFVNGIPGFII
jgi:hypothetical protein